MVVVRGVVKNGRVEPLRALDAEEGTEVTILVPRRGRGRPLLDYAGAWAESEGDDAVWEAVIHRHRVPSRTPVELE